MSAGFFRAAVLLLSGILSACASPEGPGPSQWDGRWVGHFESSLGLLGCPSRGVLDTQIVNGVMAGGGNAGPVVIAVRGSVAPDGEVIDGVFARDGLAAAVMALAGNDLRRQLEPAAVYARLKAIAPGLSRHSGCTAPMRARRIHQ